MEKLGKHICLSFFLTQCHENEPIEPVIDGAEPYWTHLESPWLKAIKLYRDLLSLRLKSLYSFGSRMKLMHLAEETRQREKTLKETITRFESELASLKQQLNRKVTEVKKNEEELRKRQVKVFVGLRLPEGFITLGP